MRRVVRTLWRSTDRGQTWEPCDVYAGSPLAAGIHHEPDGHFDDGWGNWYRNSPPRQR